MDFTGNFMMGDFATSRTTESVRGPTVLLSDVMDFFFISHPLSGRKEGEESERIMYFNPKKESVKKQTHITGFAEAIVNFTLNFGEEGSECNLPFPYRYVRTAKQEHVYLIVENSKFMIGIGLNKSLCDLLGYTIYAPCVSSVVITAYLTFVLFFGPFEDLLVADRALLKDRFEYFFSRYLSLLRLNQMPFVDFFRGVDFLPLDSVNYLRVDNLLGHLKERFPCISRAMFLYKEQLVSYTVPKSNLPVLFRYLTQNLLNMSLRAELQPEHQAGSGMKSDSQHHHGKFLTGTTDVSAEALIASGKGIKLPVVYLFEDEHTLRPYEMIVYRALNATVCMFVRLDVESDFLRELDAMLGPELTSLASHIGESYVAPSNGLIGDTNFHYLYYNPASESLKTSFKPQDESPSEGNRTSNLPTVSAPLCRTVCNTMWGFLEEEEDGEVTVQWETSWWITVKRTNKRLLLVLLHNPSLTSIADAKLYTANLIKTHFDSMFLL